MAQRLVLAAAMLTVGACTVRSQRAPGLNRGSVFPPARETKPLGGQFVLDPTAFAFKLQGAGTDLSLIHI